MSRADAIAMAAEALVGAPFRLHGRSPATGLDCVGLVIHALNATGVRATAPSGYRLRNSRIDHLLDPSASELVPVHGAIARGDVVLVQAGPAQQHLCIALGPERFVHAHAGLRRVAIHDGPLPWPVIRHWRPHRQEQE